MKSRFPQQGKVFPDVDGGRWSARDIEYMADKGIVFGYPDGEFKPGGNLTRAEFAALICRFAKLEGQRLKICSRILTKSHWAYNYIISLKQFGTYARLRGQNLQTGRTT